jgi:hypothetical protein
MAKWVWGGTTADFNPNSDTGWFSERVFAEQHPVGSTATVLQSGGFKSQRRKVTGLTKSASFKSALQTLFTGAGTFTLTDHNSASASCQILSLQWQEVLDASNLGATFRYEAELLKR